MKPIRSFAFIAALVPLVFGVTQSRAQSALERLDQHFQEDRSGFETIAFYPEPIRDLVFAAARYPGAIVKMAEIQTQASQHFTQQLASYNQNDQEAIWDLVRFPQLVDQLVDGGPKSHRQIKAILTQYPAEIHPTALRLGQREYGLLENIARLNQRTDKTFAVLIAEYPEKAQGDLRHLVQYPELLTLLSQDIDLTFFLGDAYREAPDQLRARAASLHLTLAQQHAAALSTNASEAEDTADDYSGTDELYASSYQYDTSGFDEPTDNDADEVTINYYGAPYPYWYGYPHRYSRSRLHAHINFTPNISAAINVGLPFIYYNYSTHHNRYKSYKHRSHYRHYYRDNHHRSHHYKQHYKRNHHQKKRYNRVHYQRDRKQNRHYKSDRRQRSSEKVVYKTVPAKRSKKNKTTYKKTVTKKTSKKNKTTYKKTVTKKTSKWKKGFKQRIAKDTTKKKYIQKKNNRHKYTNKKAATSSKSKKKAATKKESKKKASPAVAIKIRR